MKSLTKRMAAAGLALCLTLSLAPAVLAAGEDAPERGVLTYTELIAPKYENAGTFNDGLAPVKQNGKWGYIDTDGKTVIPFQYDLAYSFNEDLAIVGTKTTHQEEEYSYDTYMMGFIDHKGKYTPFLMPNYDYSTDTYDLAPMDVETDFLSEDDNHFFYNGYAWLGFGAGDEFIYGTDGKPLLGDLVATGIMNEGLIPGYDVNSDAIGYMDAQGNIVKQWSEREYFGPEVTTPWGDTARSYRYISNVRPFNQGLAPVWQATYHVDTDEVTYLMGFVDRSFNWVIQPQFTNYFYTGINSKYQLFGDTGLAMVQKDGKYGAINKSGQTVIPFQYEELLPVSEGFIMFRQNGKCGYLDAAGQTKVAIPTQYEKASSFSMGMAVVYDGSKAFLIDKTGKAIPGTDKLDPSTYFVEHGDGSQSIYNPGEYVVIQENGKYGFGHIEYLPPLPAESEMSGWAYQEVTAAIEENLVPTYLQNLYLNNITRGEFCDLTIQAIEETLDQDIEDIVKAQTGKDLQSWISQYPFKDTTDSTAIAAYALGIVSGRGGGVFDPYATITRQEAAALLMRSAKVLGMDTSNVENAGFVDSDKVGVWFTDAVNFVYQINVMSGTGGNAFTPLGTYTREQSYVTIYRLFQAVMKLA